MVLQQEMVPTREVAGLRITEHDLPRPAARFDLVVEFLPRDDGLNLAIEYNTDLFDPGSIERMAGQLHVLLAGIAAGIDRPVAELSLLTEAERQRVLLECNDTGRDVAPAVLPELFEAQVTRTPHATAVAFEGGELSYADLDALIMVAAVGDFRVESPAEQKVKRGEHALVLRLVPNPDLLAATAAISSIKRPIRVGFAAETHDLVEHAVEKLARKSLDLIVANDVSSDVFGADTNQVTLLWSDGRRAELARMSKTAVADRVLDAVSSLLTS